MSDYRNILISLGWRTLGALPFFVLGYYLMASAGGGYVSAFGLVLLGFSVLGMGATILAPPLAHLVSESWGSLFFPGSRFAKPQPVYGIPEAKVKQGHYEEALSLYDEIARDHPNEVKPYIEMIDITIVRLKDAHRADAIYQKGIITLKRPEDRAQLTRMYKAISSRLKNEPVRIQHRQRADKK